jgi:transposase-like protein
MVKNLQHLTKIFNSEKKCIDFLIKQRWNNEPVCPYCGHKKAYIIEGGKRFKCANSECYKKFSVTVGTIFHASNIKLNIWFKAVYLILSHKKGISSCQLARDLGTTQKTAWFMLHRIRESLKETNPEMLFGTVEADETYMSRKYASDYKGLPPEEVEKKLQGKLTKRGAVLGIYNRESNKMIVKAFSELKADAVRQEIKKRVSPGAFLVTDESRLYIKGYEDYYQFKVDHWLGEWARGIIHVNQVENFWSVMKRGVYGIYHHISFKHLQAYANEFSFRYNSRKIKDGERFAKHLRNLEHRLSYKQLVHGKDSQKETDQTTQKEG